MFVWALFGDTVMRIKKKNSMKIKLCSAEFFMPDAFCRNWHMYLFYNKYYIIENFFQNC